MGHLGHHPVGHREQRGLWAQAGHRSPSWPIGTLAQPGPYASGVGARVRVRRVYLCWAYILVAVRAFIRYSTERVVAAS